MASATLEETFPHCGWERKMDNFISEIKLPVAHMAVIRKKNPSVSF